MIPATVNAAKYRDTLYGAPYYTDGALFYFRSDLLKAAGVAAPPKTWDEMKAACERSWPSPKPRACPATPASSTRTRPSPSTSPRPWPPPAARIVDAEGKPTVNTAEAKQGLNLLVDGFKDGLFPSDAITYLEEQGRRAFQDGKVVFLRNWPFLYSSLSATDGSSYVAGKFDITSIPGTDGPGVSTLGGRNLAVSPFTAEQGHGPGVHQVLHQPGTGPEAPGPQLPRPGLRRALRGPRRRGQAPVLPHPARSLTNAQPRPKVVQYGATTKAIQEEAYAALTGAKDTDTALKDMQAKLEEITAK